MARGRNRGGMYGPPHGSGPHFPLHSQGPPQPEEHWMGPPHRDDPGQNFMRGPPPRYRMPMGRMPEPQFHAGPGPRPAHRPVDMKPMDYRPNNDTDLRFSRGPDMPNDFRFEADRPRMDSGHFPSRMYDHGADDEPEYAPMERGLPRPMDYEPGPNRFRPEQERGYVEPHFEPVESNFAPDRGGIGQRGHHRPMEIECAPDRRRFGPGDHFGPMESDCGPDSRQFGGGDRFGPMESDFEQETQCAPANRFGQNEPDFRADMRQFGPGDSFRQNQNESDYMQDRRQGGPDHFGQMENDYAQDMRHRGPGEHFRQVGSDFMPGTSRCGPGGHFGVAEPDFGPGPRHCGPPGDRFAPMESDFGPGPRRCGPGDRFGPMQPDFEQDARGCGPADGFGQNESEFEQGTHRFGPGERFRPMESGFRQDRRQFGPGDHFGQMEPDFVPDTRRCGPVDDFGPVNSGLSQEDDHYTPVSQRVGPIDDRVRPFDPHFEPEEDHFLPDNQLLEEGRREEEESFLPVNQMVVSVGPIERTVIIGSVVENQDFDLDGPVEQAPPLFPIHGGDPPCDGPARVPGSGPSAPPPGPTAAPHAPPTPQSTAPAATDKAKGPTKAPTAATAQHKPPPGRSTGVISFIGDNNGIIEREDLKRFSFSFSVFMGNIKNLVPGVKVHFTLFKNKKKQEFATDVSIPPGGTEELDTEVFMGVINKHITEGSKGGLIEATPYGKLLVLPFGKADCQWTLFMNDRVAFQVVTDLVTRAKRATSVKPQFPATVRYTREKREMGVIMSIKHGSCSIMSENHSNLQATVKENLSEGELAVMDEVEFTALPEGAVRLLKLPEGSVKFSSSAKNKEMKEMSEANATMKSKWKPFGATSPAEQEVLEEVSSEFFNGTVLRLPAKDQEAASSMLLNRNKEFLLGSLQTWDGGEEKKLSFSEDDVLMKATMRVGDKVQFKISTNPKTKTERAVSVEILPDTFKSTQEQRETGVVVGLSNIFEFGYIKYPRDPELYFKFCEVMEEKELTLLEKVEFTVMPKTTPETGEQAIRVKRQSECVFSPAPKLEGLGAADKEKKKMTINLLKDSVQTQHVGTKTDFGDLNIAKTEELSPCAKNAKITKEPLKEHLNEGKQSTKDAVVTTVAMKKDQSEDKQLIQKVTTKEAPKENVSEAKTKEESAENEKSTSLKTGSDASSKNQDRESRSDDQHRSSNKDGRQTGSKEKSDRDRKSRSRSRERRRHSRSRSRDRSREDSGKKEKNSSSSQKNSNRSRSRSNDRSGRSDHRSRRSSSREGRRGNKERSDKDRSRSRSRSRDRNGKTDGHRSQRSSSRERRRGSTERSGRDRRSRSRSRDRSTRHRQSRSRSRDRDRDRDRDRNRERDRDKDRDRRRSHSVERRDERRGRRSSSRDRSTRRRSRSRSSSPKRKTTVVASKPLSASVSSSGSFSNSQPVPAPVPTSEVSKEQVARSGMVDKELARKKKELEVLNEMIARKRAIVALEQKKRTPVLDPKEQPGWMAQPLTAALREEIPKWVSPSSRHDNQDIRMPTTPIKSILKKPTQSFLETTAPPKDEGGPEPQKPLVSQPLSSRLFPIPEPLPPHQTALTYPVQTPRPASVHPAGPETAPAPHPSGFTEHSLLQQRLNPPLQQTAPEAKDSASVQMQRFLKLLNQGVDTKLLSAMVKEAKEESAAIEQKQSVPPRMESHRNEPYDPFTATEEQEYSGKDDLLPHERAVEDGSGFSRIVGMKPGLYVEDQFLKTSKVEEEEHFLYGDTVAEDERRGQYSQGPQRYKSSMPPELSREELLARLRQHKEMAAASGSKPAAKEQSFDRIQNLFKALGIEGIDLNSSTVSQLTDRTRERLYGGKTATVPSDSKKRKHSPSRHRSRTDSSDSDHYRSASPDKPPKRQVFLSYRDQQQHDTKPDLHTGKKITSLDLRGLTRTIRNTPETPILQSPQATAGSQPSTPRPDLSQFTYQAPTVPDYAYPDKAPYGAPAYAEPVYTPSPFVVNHPALPPPPPSAYNPYTFAAGQAYPPPAYPPPPAVTSSAIGGPGLPPPPLPPHMHPSSSYSSMIYPPNPPSTHSYMEPQLPATSVVPILQPQSVQNISTVKSRCLKVIETTVGLAEEVKIPSNAAVLQTKPTLTEDDVKERQKKRLEQINQRLKEKNVKLMEARKTNKKESATGHVSSEEVKNVWICGHSLVTLAEKISRQSPEVAMPLSMDPDCVRICWKGVHGMTWDQLVPQLHQLKLNWPNPDLLIIHLGGNDINKGTAEELLSSIKRDLTSIRSIFPQCLIVWSDILPRRKWKQGILPLEQVDRVRDMINCRVHAILAELGGTAVTHENIGPELYCPDGVRLSKKGLEAFNLNLEDFLEKWKNEVCQEARSN